jgi:hypothetical protein
MISQVHQYILVHSRIRLIIVPCAYQNEEWLTSLKSIGIEINIPSYTWLWEDSIPHQMVCYHVLRQLGVYLCNGNSGRGELDSRSYYIEKCSSGNGK